jgi:uncharacterized protein YdhG (YjbR/CyaY superfamily)
MKADKPASVDTYIATFPENVQKILERIRMTVMRAAPEAAETISYGMPAYRYKGKVIIYFAGYQNHIGVYATPLAHKVFQNELYGYKQGRGSVQFPIDKPMPLDLIKRMVQFRVKQQDEPLTDIFAGLPAPARRALQSNGIKTLADLAQHTEAEILSFHGIGKTAIPILEKALKEKKLKFKKEKGK